MIQKLKNSSAVLFLMLLFLARSVQLGQAREIEYITWDLQTEIPVEKGQILVLGPEHSTTSASQLILEQDQAQSRVEEINELNEIGRDQLYLKNDPQTFKHVLKNPSVGAGQETLRISPILTWVKGTSALDADSSKAAQPSSKTSPFQKGLNQTTEWFTLYQIQGDQIDILKNIESWQVQKPEFLFAPNFIYEAVDVISNKRALKNQWNSLLDFAQTPLWAWQQENEQHNVFLASAQNQKTLHRALLLWPQNFGGKKGREEFPAPARYRWDLEMMKIPEAHQFLNQQEIENSKDWLAKFQKVKVGVLDTGLFGRHPVLKNYSNPFSIYHVFFYNGARTFTSDREYESPQKGVRYNAQTQKWEDYQVTGGWHDWVGHGTHVAGTILGSLSAENDFTGIAAGYELTPIKVLDDEGSGSSSEILQGLYYALKKGVKVVNLSLGGHARDTLSQKVYEEVYRDGLIVVAAAGNDYEHGNPTFYPAAFPTTLAVASLGSDERLSYFSEAGEWVDVAAPGGDGHKKNKEGGYRQIFSTYTADPQARQHKWRDPKEPGEDGKFWVGMSGTSMATPHVTGLVALLKSLDPKLSLEKIKTLLQNTGSVPQGGFYPEQTKKSPNVRAVDALKAVSTLWAEKNQPTPNPNDPKPNPDPENPGPKPKPDPNPVPDPKNPPTKPVNFPWKKVFFTFQKQLPAAQVFWTKAVLTDFTGQKWLFKPEKGLKVDWSLPEMAAEFLDLPRALAPRKRSSGNILDLNLLIEEKEVLVSLTFDALENNSQQEVWKGVINGAHWKLIWSADLSTQSYRLSWEPFEEPPVP